MQVLVKILERRFREGRTALSSLMRELADAGGEVLSAAEGALWRVVQAIGGKVGAPHMNGNRVVKFFGQKH